jgi:8-oxo-dGTP diphosphatase
MKVTDVAVAVFLKPDASFLLSSRPEGKPYAGYWEFPGGKIESGESVREALTRELTEELNVVIDEATPWFTFMMHYEHATVRLHTWRVNKWHHVDERGMCGLEGQEFVWQRQSSLTVAPTLPGCAPIFRALQLPLHYIITNASAVGTDTYLEQIRAVWDKSASKHPPIGEFGYSAPRLIQVREPTMSATQRRDFAQALVHLAHQKNAKVLVNSDVSLAKAIGADGVHLPSAQLLACTARPDFELVGASVHNRAELDSAVQLKCDFAVLGSVAATATHPGQTPLGWANFAAIAEDSGLPVYAIGGMTQADLALAQRHGAHGVAMQRSALAGLLAK